MEPSNINSPQQPQPKIKCKEDGHSSEDDEPVRWNFTAF